MHAAKDAMNAGRVAPEAFDELRRRFNAIQVRAIEAFGEQALLESVRTIDMEKYRPPMPGEFEKQKPIELSTAAPTAGALRLVRARCLVDEIRDQALALGWTIRSLYFSDEYERHPSLAGYGLVCFIGASDHIGHVCRESTEIICPPPAKIRSRFYNPDVGQPWIRKVRP